MKYLAWLSVFVLASCASNNATGALTGGAIGAAVGGVAGGGKGAWIGSAAGLITGGLIGAALDMQERKVMEKASPRTVSRMDESQPLTINDVIKLSQGGVSDDTIIQYMRDTGSYYQLTPSQMRRLQDAGVSERVIHNMVISGK